jgi:hypothetical protein
MAAPITDVNVLINASGCHSASVLGLADRMAIDIANLSAQLNGIGGTNYVGNLNQLIIDSACWATLQPDELKQVESQIYRNNAVAAGAVPGDISAELLSAACILNASKIQLEAAKLFLIASLGVGKTFPQ